MSAEIEEFYGLLGELRKRLGAERRLIDCDGRQDWPQRGVYFFFEPGEARADGMPRVVRVGTHALRVTSRAILWGRLSQHRGHVLGSRPGGGNHRGSVFRLHVGQSLLARDGDREGAARTWGQGQAASVVVRAAEYQHEREVSAYIGRMPFLWLEVDDPPGPTSDRAAIESGAIGLLSRRANRSADSPSAQWLGQHSDRSAVRESGLWNVNHVDGYRNDSLARLRFWVERT